MEVIVLSDSSDESETALASAATTPAASPAAQWKPAQSVGYANAVDAALAMAAALETTENGNGRKRNELKTKKKKLAPPLLPAKFKKQLNSRRMQQIAAERRPRPAEKARRMASNHRQRGRSGQRSMEPLRSRTRSSSSSSSSDSSSSSSLSSSSGPRSRSRSRPRFRHAVSGGRVQEERRFAKAAAGRVVQSAQRERDSSGGNKRPNSETQRRVAVDQQTPTKNQSSVEVVDLMSSSSSSSDSCDSSRSRSSSASSVASSAGRSLARTPVKSGKKRLVLNNRVLGKGAPRPVQFSNQHAQYTDTSNRVQGGNNHIRSKIVVNAPGKRKRVLPQMCRGSSGDVSRQGRAPLDNRAKTGDTDKKSATNGARSQPLALSGSATASKSSPQLISSSSASSSPTSPPSAVPSRKSVSAPSNTTQTSGACEGETDAFGRYHCRKTVSTHTRPSHKRTPALSLRGSPSSSPSPRKKRRVFTYFNTDNVALNDIQAQERELAWIRLQRKQTQNRPPTDPVQKDKISREVIDVDNHSDTNSAGHLENAVHSDNHRAHVKGKAKHVNNVKQTPSAFYRDALVHPTSYRGIYLDEAPSNILSLRECKLPFESNCNQPLTFYADSDRLARQCAILESFGKPTQCISSVFPGEAAKPQSEVTRAVSTLVAAQLPIIRSCHRRKIQAILFEARQKISKYQVALKKQRRSHHSQNVMSHRLHRSVKEKIVVRNLKTVKHLSVGSVSFQIGRGDGFVREKSVSSLIQVGCVEEIRPLRKYTTSIGLRANYHVEDDPILRYTATTRPNGASGVGEVEQKYGLRMGNVADDEVVEYVLRLVVGRLGDSEQVFQALKSELDFSQAYTAYGELKKMHDSRERAVDRLERVEKLRHRGVHGADSDVTAIINLMERSSLAKASQVKSLSRRLQPPTRNLESSFVDSLVDSATSGMAMLGLRATDSYEELADVYCGSFCRMCYMYACHEHGGDHPLPARRVEPAYPRVQSAPRVASGVEDVHVSAASSDDDMGYVSSEGRGNVGLAHAAARARDESGASSANSNGGGDVDMSDDDRQQRRQLADPSEYVDASHVSLVAAKMHSFLSTNNSCGEQCWKSERPVDGVKQSAVVSAAELGVIRKLRETMGDNSCLLAAVVGSISCIDLRDWIDGEQNSNEVGAADGVGRSGRRMRNWKHGRRSGGSNHELLQRTRNQRLQDRGTENHEYKPCMHEGMCDSTGCSCMKRDHMCEKACACSRDCPNRFEGCTCASGECRTNKCPCFAALRECDPDVCSSCGASDVAVVVAVAGNDDRIDRCGRLSCGNVNVIRSKHMRLSMSFSSIHGYGMYAREAIAANEFVYEYTGAMLSQDEAERRGLIYDKMEMSYLFDLNEDAVLDALRCGNKSKFINHNGETPNCTAKVVSVSGVHHITIWALRDMAVGEELVFDYGYKRSVGPDWSQRRAASKDTV